MNAIGDVPQGDRLIVIESLLEKEAGVMGIVSFWNPDLENSMTSLEREHVDRLLARVSRALVPVLVRRMAKQS